MKKYLDKSKVGFSQVMYATRSGRKTVLRLTDGRTLETFIPIRRLVEDAPEGMLRSINKGVVIAPAHLKEVSGGTYTMADGTQFQARVRMNKAQAAAMLPAARPAQAEVPQAPGNVSWEQFAVLDELPLAFCVIELVFDEKGHGLDFIFRYCNQAMEVLEGKRIDEMLDRSFYEVFENGDRKWLVAYADVALNGVKRVIESYSPEIGTNLRIYCYQPRPSFCACMLVKV